MTQIKSITEVNVGDVITFMGWGIPITIKVTELLRTRVGFIRDVNEGHFWK